MSSSMVAFFNGCFLQLGSALSGFLFSKGSIVLKKKVKMSKQEKQGSWVQGVCFNVQHIVNRYPSV